MKIDKEMVIKATDIFASSQTNVFWFATVCHQLHFIRAKQLAPIHSETLR